MKISFNNDYILIENFQNLVEALVPNYVKLLENAEYVDKIRFLNTINETDFKVVCSCTITENFNIKLGNRIYPVIFSDENAPAISEPSDGNDTNSLETITSFEINYENKEVLIKNTSQESKTFEFTLHKFFIQSFPDFILQTENFSLIVEPNTNKIVFNLQDGYVFRLMTEFEGYETKIEDYYAYPIYYFSNTKSLKTAFTRASINIEAYSEEDLKIMISDKSMKIKRGFGMLDEQCRNIELQPILKELCELYNIQEQSLIGLVSYGAGEASTPNSANNNSGLKLKLGNFETDGKSSNSINISSSSGDVSISKRIEQLEITLKDSIIKQAHSVHNETYIEKRNFRKMVIRNVDFS